MCLSAAGTPGRLQAPPSAASRALCCAARIYLVYYVYWGDTGQQTAYVSTYNSTTHRPCVALSGHHPLASFRHRVCDPCDALQPPTLPFRYPPHCHPCLQSKRNHQRNSHQPARKWDKAPAKSTADKGQVSPKHTKSRTSQPTSKMDRGLEQTSFSQEDKEMANGT